MPENTPRLGLPKPLGNENVNRASYNALIDSIDAAAAKKEDLDSHTADNVKHITAAERTAWNSKETPGGAQAKANAAETSAKNHANALIGVLSSLTTEQRANLVAAINELVTKVGTAQTTANAALPRSGGKLTGNIEMDKDAPSISLLHNGLQKAQFYYVPGDDTLYLFRKDGTGTYRGGIRFKPDNKVEVYNGSVYNELLTAGSAIDPEITAPAESADQSAYPEGISIMSVSGWSVGNGTVMTIKVIALTRTVQIFVRANASTPTIMYFRNHTSGGTWTPWSADADTIKGYGGISGGSANSTLITTDHGNMQLGPLNADYCHINTDRPNFYFYKDLFIAGGGNKVWHRGELRWNSGRIEYNDGGTWKDSARGTVLNLFFSDTHVVPKETTTSAQSDYTTAGGAQGSFLDYPFYVDPVLVSGGRTIYFEVVLRSMDGSGAYMELHRESSQIAQIMVTSMNFVRVRSSAIAVSSVSGQTLTLRIQANNRIAQLKAARLIIV